MTDYEILGIDANADEKTIKKLESLLLASSKENYDVIRKLCTKNSFPS